MSNVEERLDAIEFVLELAMGFIHRERPEYLEGQAEAARTLADQLPEGRQKRTWSQVAGLLESAATSHEPDHGSRAARLRFDG